MDAEIQRARAKLRNLKDLPEDIRPLVQGGYTECLQKAQAELDSAQAARRAANPTKQQLGQVEAHKARMDKKLASARQRLQSFEAEQAALAQKINDQRREVLEAEGAAARAAEEVAQLAARFASERVPGAGEGSPTPAAAGVAQAGAPAAPAGFVSVAFAEEKWAEREAAFAEQIAQLEALVGAPGEGTLHKDEEAPMATEDLLEDETWTTIGKERRKRVLRIERDVLATKVSSTLGKVRGVASPFKKR